MSASQPVMTKAPQVKVPRYAQPGEVVAIKTKAWHPMETGWRKGRDGKEIPRNRIHTFVCTFNDNDVISADFHSGVSSNPYLTFHMRVPGDGFFKFVWTADDGQEITATARLSTAGA